MNRRTQLRQNQDSEKDSRASARSAGLLFFSDERPGIRRQVRGRSAVYLDPNGRRVRERKTLARIRALAVPPAWTDVWIARRADAHLQATGRDAKKRKQYRYHTRWREGRDAAKYDRVVVFAKALPRICRRVRRDRKAAMASAYSIPSFEQSTQPAHQALLGLRQSFSGCPFVFLIAFQAVVRHSTWGTMNFCRFVFVGCSDASD